MLQTQDAMKKPLRMRSGTYRALLAKYPIGRSHDAVKAVVNRNYGMHEMMHPETPAGNVTAWWRTTK